MPLAALLILFLLGGCALQPPEAPGEEPIPNPELNEQVLSLPGDPVNPVTLQVTLFTPRGPGPFPLAVLNHGKQIGPPSQQKRDRPIFFVRYFLSRGYAVLVPMLRGFAGSGGVFEVHGCDTGSDGLAQARDIAAVIAAARQMPAIDANRVIVAGQSFGGWNTLALGVLSVPGVRGLIDFSGGVRKPPCIGWGADLATAAGAFGARTRVPSLWFYGENDRVFPTEVWRGMYRAYVAAGGPATLVDYGNFMSDAHQMGGYPEGLPLWTPHADAFLAGLGLPARELDASYLPAVPPPPSHFAALQDLTAIPLVGEVGRGLYQKFLTMPLPRVFLIGGLARGVVAASGGFDTLGFAMRNCHTHYAECRVYAVDNDVVWTGWH